MKQIDFLSAYQNQTQRDYRKRLLDDDKAECASIAKAWGKDYWDGERKHGYGGMRYDGRWRPIARAMASHYGLKPGCRMLDVGCGKAYLLYELSREVSPSDCFGVDVSEYGIRNSKDEMRSSLAVADAACLPYPDDSFDFVVSLNVLHNLPLSKLMDAVKEIERVRRANSYIVVESWRNEIEKANLLAWQLTCESFHPPEVWAWIFSQAGYSGDYGFIYFE